MADKEKESRGCLPKIGFASPWPVLTIGMLLGIIGASCGSTCTVRIPLTKTSVSGGSSIGLKDLTRKALPTYLEDRIGGNQDFLNSSAQLSVWFAEGTGILGIGEYPEAPLVDWHLTLVTRNNKNYLGWPGSPVRSDNGR